MKRNIIIMYIILIMIIMKNNNNIEIEYRIIGGGIIDSMNIILIGLTTIITPIIYLMKIEGKKEIEIISIIIIIILLTNNIFYFFIFYELLLVPLYIYLISKKGITPEAGYRLIIYTILGSIFLLIGLIIIYIKYGSFNIEYINLINKYNNYNNNFNSLLLFFLFLSFIIKYPIFPFHIWLPILHVESPTIGSVYLAAIILKLAYYGIIRYIIPILKEEEEYLIEWLYILSTISILYPSILNIKEIDIKKIIAYSSIIHMNYSIFGLFSKDISSLISSYILIISHGFISASLFLLIGILSQRYHSRNLFYFRGLFPIMPLFSFILLITILANISLPFTSSFIPEFFIFINLLHHNLFLASSFFLSLFFSSLYNLWFLLRILFGPLSPYISLYLDLSFNEFLLFLPFLFFILLTSFFFTPLSNLLFPNLLLLL